MKINNKELLKNLKMINYYKNWIDRYSRIDNVSDNYFRKLKFKKWFKFKMYLFFLPLKNIYFLIIVLFISLLLTILEGQVIIK